MSVATEMPAEIAFNIPRQRADFITDQFRQQADITLLFPLEQMADKETNALRGRYLHPSGFKHDADEYRYKAGGQ